MIKGNNPGNIRPSKVKWIGEGDPENGFCTFDTAIHGLRALALDLYNANVLDGLDTIQEITDHYAPVSENNSIEYASIVGGITGFFISSPISLQDRSVALSYIRAVIIAENGHAPGYTEWYSPFTIKAAMNEARKWNQWT